MRITAIIPTYNESENIKGLVEEILALPLEGVHVLVVDDNSPDGTGRMADEMAASDGRVEVIHRPGKMGLGTAYIAGFKKALTDGSDLAITMDADFSHHPRYIPEMVKLGKSYHLVIGSRYVPGGGVRNWGVGRRFLSWGANLVARTVLGFDAKDCTAGFRCYRREVLLSIDLDGIFSNGYSFLTEILYKCQMAGFCTAEVPIIFENRRLGSSKISQKEIFKAMYTVFRLGMERPFHRRAAPRPRLPLAE